MMPITYRRHSESADGFTNMLDYQDRDEHYWFELIEERTLDWSFETEASLRLDVLLKQPIAHEDPSFDE